MATLSGTCAGGWFAATAPLLRKVGDVLLDPATRQDLNLKCWLVAQDTWDCADKETSQEIYKVNVPATVDALHAVAHLFLLCFCKAHGYSWPLQVMRTGCCIQEGGCLLPQAKVAPVV